ncbi:MAG: CFI-box-CTERM domain-containing protein, partial [Pseudomonadota bacterium]
QGQIRVGLTTDGDEELSSGEFTDQLQFIVSRLEPADPTGSAENNLCTDTGSAGVCNFVAYPGDKKVFIENVRGDCSFPQFNDATIEAVRVFYQVDPATNGFPTISTGTFADFDISESNQSCVSSAEVLGLADNEIGNLENGQSYGFAIGMVDQTDNVGYVTNMAGFGVSTDPLDPASCFDTSGAEFPQNCHVAQPAEVIGLFSEDLDCFVTTAAYGSPFQEKVQTFRSFRDAFLRPSRIGRFVMSFYYRFSPPLANYIHRNDHLKPYARIVLWPLWFFAFISLKGYGLLGLFCTLLGLHFYFRQQQVRSQ